MPVVVEPPKKLAVHRGVWSTPPVLGTGNRWFESSCADIYRGVEQLVARQAHNLKVAGPSPAPATNKR